MSRVLVIRFSALGDITLTLSGVDHLKSRGHEVHYLTKRSFAPLIKTYGAVTEVHTISDHASFSELLATARSLKKLNFDFVYDLHRNLRSRIATAIIGRPFRRVLKYRFKEFLLYLIRGVGFRALGLNPIDRKGETLRVVEAERATVRIDGMGDARKQVMANVRLEQTQTWQDWIERQTAGYVCVAVESAWRQKEWATERFVEVARQLIEQGYGVVWLGLRPLPSEAMLQGSLDLTTKLDLPQVMRVLAGARALVCNDSGLMHVAESLGTPVAAIFGPTSRELGFAPRLNASRVIETKMWCRPCSKTGRWCIRPMDRRKCLSDITVAQAMNTIREVLKKEPRE